MQTATRPQLFIGKTHIDLWGSGRLDFSFRGAAMQCGQMCREPRFGLPVRPGHKRQHQSETSGMELLDLGAQAAPSKSNGVLLPLVQPPQ